jgi:signal transduction histidine kinase
MPDQQSYEEQLKAANEAVYKHSLELARLKQELELTNQKQESLIHFIGHEVKGYLTKDKAAFASLLEGDYGPLPENIITFLTQALASATEGADAAIDILKAANLKKGTVTYTKEPFDLRTLVQKWVDKFKPVAEGKGLQFSFTVDESSTPYTFTGDESQLGDHVLRNLIENSINYTPAGSIAVSLGKSDGKFMFSVKDTGVGISEDDMKKLFTEGGKGADSLKVNVHSTGYGLFIAKNVTEAHKGTIRAESEGAGKGSTFTVELPAA